MGDRAQEEAEDKTQGWQDMTQRTGEQDAKSRDGAKRWRTGVSGRKDGRTGCQGQENRTQLPEQRAQRDEIGK
jgi:hypothetical protein